MNIKTKSKSTILPENLAGYFGSKMNQYRIKFFSLIISALCKVQTVNFEKLVCSFDSEAKMESVLWRIQRFISEYALDIDLIGDLSFHCFRTNHLLIYYITTI